MYLRDFVEPIDLMSSSRGNFTGKVGIYMQTDRIGDACKHTFYLYRHRRQRQRRNRLA